MLAVSRQVEPNGGWEPDPVVLFGQAGIRLIDLPTAALDRSGAIVLAGIGEDGASTCGARLRPGSASRSGTGGRCPDGRPS